MNDPASPVSAALKVVSFVKALGDGFWKTWDVPYHHMGATIADASLQAGLNYDRVVAPRVLALRVQHPESRTTRQFIDLTERVPLTELLKWTHPEKLQRVRDALSFFYREGIETERDLHSWIAVPENRQRMLRLRGVGPKTFDYYKLLAGHSTVAIDRHLFAFLKRAGVECDHYETAQRLLEETAAILGRSASSLDYSIWQDQVNRAGGKWYDHRRLCGCRTG